MEFISVENPNYKLSISSYFILGCIHVLVFFISSPGYILYIYRCLESAPRRSLIKKL